jgi:hypothetical protein
MKKSLKGVGNLSRKLIAILVMAAMSSLGYAVDNSIYIDQTGDNAVINITQDGAGNTVKGVVNGAPGTRGVDAATIGAMNTNIAVSQVGSGNSLALGVNATVATGRSADIVYSVTGQGSTALIDVNASGQGSASNIIIGVEQTGGTSNFKADVQGSGSTLSVTTAGPGDDVQSKMRGDTNTASIMFSGTGGSNQAILDQSGTGTNDIGITTSGTGNLFNVLQAGYGNTASVGGYASGSTLNGNDNQIQIVQNGDGNTANLGISGSTNYVGINQGSGSTYGGQSANVKINGSGNSVNISQGMSVPLLTLPTRTP